MKTLCYVTDLLKQYGVQLSAVKFNQLLLSKGILIIKNRESTTKPGVFKQYKAIADEYLKWGENVLSAPYNDANGVPVQRDETTPMWYDTDFLELLDHLGLLPF